MLKVLSLFSGIGGFDLGFAATEQFQTVAFVESSPFCQRVLRKHWPHVPIYQDVRNVSVTQGTADVFCGGFPCQDVSNANAVRRGGQQSILGDRSGLWFEFARLIEEGHPRWVVIENVEALRNRGMGFILSKLASLGYDAEWHVIRACDAGFPHRRERLWIIAHAHSERREGVSPIPLEGLRGLPWRENCRSAQEWARRRDIAEGNLLRGYNGIPHYVDRITALGNSIVPQIAYYIGTAILKAEQQNGSHS